MGEIADGLAQGLWLVFSLDADLYEIAVRSLQVTVTSAGGDYHAADRLDCAPDVA